MWFCIDSQQNAVIAQYHICCGSLGIECHGVAFSSVGNSDNGEIHSMDFITYLRLFTYILQAEITVGRVCKVAWRINCLLCSHSDAQCCLWQKIYSPFRYPGLVLLDFCLCHDAATQ